MEIEDIKIYFKDPYFTFPVWVRSLLRIIYYCLFFIFIFATITFLF